MDVASDDVALYLINHGYGDDNDKAKLLCRACGQDRLDIVKELVEDHGLDPKGKYYNLILQVAALALLRVPEAHCTHLVIAHLK